MHVQSHCLQGVASGQQFQKALGQEPIKTGVRLPRCSELAILVEGTLHTEKFNRAFVQFRSGKSMLVE